MTYYVSGVRKSELLDIQWPQVDFEADSILLEKGAAKTDDPRTLPILQGDMRDLLLASWEERQAKWPDSPWVFNRCGVQIKDFRGAWNDACNRAGVPDLLIHDLRRTATRNMRRAGVPQVVRMKISGHKTDSMERRYDIAGEEGLGNAKELMSRRMNAGGMVWTSPRISRNSQTSAGTQRPQRQRPRHSRRSLQNSAGALPRW